MAESKKILLLGSSGLLSGAAPPLSHEGYAHRPVELALAARLARKL